MTWMVLILAACFVLEALVIVKLDQLRSADLRALDRRTLNLLERVNELADEVQRAPRHDAVAQLFERISMLERRPFGGHSER